MFAGNVDLDQYDKALLSKFCIPTRPRQVAYLEKSTRLILKRDIEGGLQAGKLYLMDRKDVRIGIFEWRQFLSRFDFFLALPGQVMPFCHNVVEAMSVGTIPVLHEGYAWLFVPELNGGVNCLVYRDDTLENVLETAMNMDRQEIRCLRKEVYDYYNSYLIPKAVVAKVMDSTIDQISLCGEGTSVEMMDSGS
jgi:hypothetical protein